MRNRLGRGSTFFFWVSLILLNSPLCFVWAEQVAARAPRIGFVLPLSGDWAFLGSGIRDGALLAQADLLAASQKIELIFEDNRGELATSVGLAQKLINSDKVDALISIISGVSKLLKPMAKKAGIINIGICSEPEVADGELSFINYLTAQQGVSKFLEYLGPNKSLGIFYQNESGFVRIVSELQSRVGNTNPIIFSDAFDRGITDFKPMLLRRKYTQPSTFLILGLSPEIELLAKQARLVGLRSTLTSIESFGLASDKSAFNGAWYVDSAMPSPKFQARFVNKYGREPTPGTGQSYDSVALLAHAFAESSRLSSEIDHVRVAEVFRTISGFSGVTGSLKVRSDGVIWSEASIKSIENGKPVILNLPPA